jgi:hypothetical protein
MKRRDDFLPSILLNCREAFEPQNTGRVNLGKLPPLKNSIYVKKCPSKSNEGHPTSGLPSLSDNQPRIAFDFPEYLVSGASSFPSDISHIVDDLNPPEEANVVRIGDDRILINPDVENIFRDPLGAGSVQGHDIDQGRKLVAPIFNHSQTGHADESRREGTPAFKILNSTNLNSLDHSSAAHPCIDDKACATDRNNIGSSPLSLSVDERIRPSTSWPLMPGPIRSQSRPQRRSSVIHHSQNLTGSTCATLACQGRPGPSPPPNRFPEAWDTPKCPWPTAPSHRRKRIIPARPAIVGQGPHAARRERRRRRRRRRQVRRWCWRRRRRRRRRRRNPKPAAVSAWDSTAQRRRPPLPHPARSRRLLARLCRRPRRSRLDGPAGRQRLRPSCTKMLMAAAAVAAVAARAA